MRKILFLFFVGWFISGYVFAQKVSEVELSILATRSWIRLELSENNSLPKGSKLYWSTSKRKPQQANYQTVADVKRYYIQDIEPETYYHIWLELPSGEVIKRKVYSTKEWDLEPVDLQEAASNPSSKAVPPGMEIYWQDEFNDELLNLNKWTTNYFSSLNYLNKESLQEMLTDKLPQPAYTMSGQYINLYVNDTIPDRLYTKTGTQKISSIQTYDWRKNENLLDNSRGGYFEVKVRRNSKGNPKGLNTAFWFDAIRPYTSQCLYSKRRERK